MISNVTRLKMCVTSIGMRDIVQALKSRGETSLARQLEDYSIDCKKGPKFIEKLKEQGEVHFETMVSILTRFFGKPRQRGTSHKVFKTPWGGILTIQDNKGKAKRYQVKQVKRALKRLLQDKCDLDYGIEASKTQKPTFTLYRCGSEFLCICDQMPSLSWSCKNEALALANAMRIYDCCL